MFSNASIWQGVNLIDNVLTWVFVNIVGDGSAANANIGSESILAALSCGTGEVGYILIRAIMTVPHVFLLCLFLVVWMLIDRCIVPTMGACLVGAFPCFKSCCSNHITIDTDDNSKTFGEYINDGELAGAEIFDFASLDSFKDDVAAELNAQKLKRKLDTDLAIRRASYKDVDDLNAQKDKEDEALAVVNAEFETYASSSSGDESGTGSESGSESGTGSESESESEADDDQ